jgi:uncharacterized protein (TIGR03118 family)
MKPIHRIASTLIGGVVTLLASTSVVASPYDQTNLVSDVTGLAQITDPNLLNPWGMSFSGTSPFWVSEQGANKTELFTYANGIAAAQAPSNAAPLIVSIPTTAGGPQGPTGQVFNSTTAFLVGAAKANFIFANLNGTISAWNPGAGTTAVIEASTTGALYTGLAITNGALGPRLYAANGAGTGSIDVFDGGFHRIATSGAFVDTDPRLAGLVPFNVTTIGSSVYVTYAPAGHLAQTTATEGHGAVAIFDADGNLVRTLIAGPDDHLASPWGLTLAPSNFGSFSGDLLVGNFSFAVGEIDAFDPTTGAFLGTLGGNDGNPLVNSGLWSIEFGNGTSAPSNVLLFSAGINGELDGLVGAIRAIPEPTTISLLGVGIAFLAAGARRRRRA